MFVDFNILNQLGSPSINSNTFANRPAAGQTGRLFVSIDTFEIYRDNGTTWDLIGGPGTSTVTGTGAATQVAYWTAAQSIGGSNNLWWDNTNGFLGVGSAVPSARIEAVKTDGIGIYANYTTNAGTGSSATAIWAKNITNSSGYGAVIEETTPNNTGGQYPLLIKHSLSTGTAAVGMGTGVHWQLPDDAGTFKTTQLTVETTDAAAATYSTRYRFNVQSNGSSTPVAYINATGLGLFTATPGAALDIHSTGIMAQLNSTSATANSLLAFQRSGSGLWRIGDAYNGGNNYFELHNTVLTNNAIQVLASSNEATFLSGKTYSTGNAIGIAVQHNLTIPNGVNVGLAALGGVNSNLNLTLQGSTTVANTGRQGLEGSTSISFTGAGTLTMTQGSTIRAFSALSSVYAFNGSAVGTITHLAGLRICFPDNVGSAVNITNNYALLINNQTTGTGTVTYTNRWGIYQEGASDVNYFAGNMLLGSTVNSGEKLQVTGTAIITTPNRTFRILTNSYSINDSTRSAGMGMDGAGLYFGNVAGNTGWNIGSTQMTLDIAGNLGLGVTPSAWFASSKALQLGSTLAPYLALFQQTTSTADGYLGWGAYLTGDRTFAYTTTGDPVSLYRLNSGNHVWFNAPSGTAGNAITFTQAMTLDASGNLGLGLSTNINQRLTILDNGNAEGLGVYRNFTGAADAGVIVTLGTTNGSGVPTGAARIIGVLNAAKTDGYLVFQTVAASSPQTRAQIEANGNFLIGTTTDAGQKLQVNGTTATGTTTVLGIDVNGEGASSTPAIRATITSNDSNAIVYRRSFNANTASCGILGQLQNSSSAFVSYTGIYTSIIDNTAGSEDGQLFFNCAKNGTLTTELIVDSNGIKTSTPTGGTAASWKLGSRVAAAVALDATQYIQLEVGGTLYKLAIVT